MVDEVQKTCPSCGAPLKEGASFCTNCGTALTAPEAAAAAAGEVTSATEAPAAAPPAAAAAPPPAQPVVPPPVPPPAGEGAPEAPMPGVAPVVPGKRSKAPLLVGIIGGVLVVAGIVVLVLWLAVWKDGGGGGASEPMALAQKYMDSLKAGDIDAYMDCFEEDFFLNEMKNSPFTQDLSEDDIKQFAQMAFEMMDVNFEGVKLEVKSEKGNQATVVTTSGTASVSVMGMEEKLDLTEQPLEFNMTKKNGTWYLTENPMGSTGTSTDFGNSTGLEDLNMQDLEQLLPEDLNMEDLKDLLPEDLNLEDLNIEDLEQLLRDLEKQLEDAST
jgi:hypothetical protein